MHSRCCIVVSILSAAKGSPSSSVAGSSIVVCPFDHPCDTRDQCGCSGKCGHLAQCGVYLIQYSRSSQKTVCASTFGLLAHALSSSPPKLSSRRCDRCLMVIITGRHFAESDGEPVCGGSAEQFEGSPRSQCWIPMHYRICVYSLSIAHATMWKKGVVLKVL